jgi:putative transposase
MNFLYYAANNRNNKTMNNKYKNKYRIESNRAQFWDYSAPGNYFLTLCIENRKCILGNVVNGVMVLSEYGNIVGTEIKIIPEYHKRVLLQKWIIMPNHIHLIITLGDYDFDNGISEIGHTENHTDTIVDTTTDTTTDTTIVEKIHEFSLPPPPLPSPQPQPQPPPQPQPQSEYDIKQYRKQRRKMLIPKILGKFQQQTSKQINVLRNTPGVKNWQKDYHDHIIRNNESYEKIKNYIINNPRNWDNDKFNNSDK